MPITILGASDARAGIWHSTMSAFTASFDGTLTAPAGRVGSMNLSLGGFTAAVQGQASVPQNRDGVINATMGAITTSVRGIFYIPPEDPPVIVSTPAPSFNEGAAAQYELSQHVVDDNISPLTYSINGSLPSGVTLNSSTGRLSYNGVGSVASTSNTFTVTDAIGGDTSSSFNIVISPEASGSFDVGALALASTDTPHQIAVSMPITGTVASNVAVKVRHTVDGASSWEQDHPLIRVGSTFSGVVFDLQPGITYDIEVTITDGSSTEIRNKTQHGTFTTRSLPALVVGQTPDYTPSTQSALQSALNSANPGDIIEIQDGTITLTGDLTMTRSGTAANPIYIRGESQAGAIISAPSNGRFKIWASYVVLENVTFQGSGGFSQQPGIMLGSSGSNPKIVANDITVRNIVMTGWSRGINAEGGTDGVNTNRCLIYQNSITGIVPWEQATIQERTYWSEDCIKLAGFGNCVWNNTLVGHGDTVTFVHSVDDSSVKCNFAYRNLIRNSIDDAFEFDYRPTLCAAYDNYVENCATLISWDVLGAPGPSYCFRNVATNIHHRPIKFGSTAEHWLFYNNTLMRAESLATSYFYGIGFAKIEASYQNNFAYRNNILIWAEGLDSPLSRDHIYWLREMAYQSNGTCEFTNNAHWPDIKIQWENDLGQDSFVNLATAKTSIRNTLPLFPSAAGLGAPTKRHTNDVISELQPFVTPIVMGETPVTEVTGQVVPVLSSGAAAKNAGVVIPGITNGFSGSSPDIGAIIDGRPVVEYGVTEGPQTDITVLSQLADGISAGQNATMTSLVNTLQNGYDIQWNTVTIFYDPDNRRIRYMGKPASGQSTEFSFYEYVESADQWTEPVGNPVDTGTGHIWSATYDTANNNYYHHRYNTNYLAYHNSSTNQWSATPTNSAGSLVAGSTPVLGALVYHPNLFGSGAPGIFAWNALGMYAYRIGTQAWSKIAAYGSGTYYNKQRGQGVYVQSADKIWVSASYSSGSVAFTVAAGAGNQSDAISSGHVVQVTNPPIIIDGAGGTTVHGHAIPDPNNPNRLLILEERGSARVWESNNAGTSWTNTGFTHPFNSMNNKSTGEWTCGIIAPYGVVIAMTSNDSGGETKIWKPNN